MSKDNENGEIFAYLCKLSKAKVGPNFVWDYCNYIQEIMGQIDTLEHYVSENKIAEASKKENEIISSLKIETAKEYLKE